VKIIFSYRIDISFLYSIVNRNVGVVQLLCIFLYFPLEDYFTILKMEIANSSENLPSHSRRQFVSTYVAKRG
jgi:hypothetical protein